METKQINEVSEASSYLKSSKCSINKSIIKSNDESYKKFINESVDKSTNSELNDKSKRSLNSDKMCKSTDHGLSFQSNSSNCNLINLTNRSLLNYSSFNDSTSTITSPNQLINCSSYSRYCNLSIQNKSSFKSCAKRSSAINDDPINCSNDKMNSIKSSNNSLNNSIYSSISKSDKKFESNFDHKFPNKFEPNSDTESINESIQKFINKSSIKSSCSSNETISFLNKSSLKSSTIKIFFLFLSYLSKSSISFTRNYHSLLVPLFFVLCTVIRISDACSARSTPKPRPPLPEIRPNITFQTYQCPEAYAKWYCLNGATCFFVRIGESILYNCECADGYMGQRCEFKDLEGSYLQSREKVLIETAKVTGGTFTILVLFAFVAIIFFANYKKRKSIRTINEPNNQLPAFIA